jgi:hypothetical protein
MKANGDEAAMIATDCNFCADFVIYGQTALFVQGLQDHLTA